MQCVRDIVRLVVFTMIYCFTERALIKSTYGVVLSELDKYVNYVDYNQCLKKVISRTYIYAAQLSS